VLVNSRVFFVVDLLDWIGFKVRFFLPKFVYFAKSFQGNGGKRCLLEASCWVFLI